DERLRHRNGAPKDRGGQQDTGISERYEVENQFLVSSFQFSVCPFLNFALHRIQFQNNASLLHCRGVSWGRSGRLPLRPARGVDRRPAVPEPRIVAPATGLRSRWTNED